MLIINQLKVSINDNTDDLTNSISKKLRISKDNVIIPEMISLFSILINQFETSITHAMNHECKIPSISSTLYGRLEC